MSFQNDEFLRKAKVTVYYDPAGKRFMNYVKVQPFDNVSGHTTNTEYMVPWLFSVGGGGISDPLSGVYQVEIEQKSGESQGQNVHQYRQVV